MNIKLNVNARKKDIINAQTASRSIKTALAETLTLTGIAVIENGGINVDKEPCDVGYLFTDKGTFGFISNVMLKNIDMLADYLTDCLNDGELCEIRFITGKTAEDQTFYSYEIV